ncbi:MAG: hypothetical protein QGG54_21050, partial [Gammaproteobacteria bacterium]|nr:hypothetical protein [Gammaproteobacteria bacterium]
MNRLHSKAVARQFALALVLLPWTLLVYGQDQLTSTGESPLVRGEQLMLTGSYAAASDIFQMADGLDRNDGLVGASQAFAMMGNYQQAMVVVEDAIEDAEYARFPLLSTQLAEIKRGIGQSSEALAILEAVVSGMANPPVRTLVQYGSLLKLVGEKQAANKVLDQAVQRYNDGLVFSSEDVAMVALASWLMDSFHDANSLFNEATRANPNNLEAHVLWADLFLEKYNASDAERSYQE